MAKRPATVVVLFLACTAGTVQARAPRTTTLSIDLLTRQVYVDDAERGRALGEEYHTTVRSEESTQIEVRHGNPLLFTYQVEIATTPSEDRAAVEKFAGAFGELLARFGTKGADVTTGAVEGLDLHGFSDQIKTTFANVDAIGNLIDLSLEPATVAKLRDSVRGWPADIDKMTSSYGKALQIHLKCMRGDLVSTDAGPVPCSSPIDVTPAILERQKAAAFGLAAVRLEESRAAVAPILTARKAAADAKAAFDQAQKVVAAAGANATATQKRALDNAKKALDGASAALESVSAGRGSALAAHDAAAKAAEDARTEWESAGVALSRATAEAAAAQQTIANFLRDALSIQTQAEKAGALLKGFAADVNNIGHKPMKTIAYSLDTTSVTLKVDKEQKYANYLSARAKAVQSKAQNAKVVISPYRVASVRPGVAFVLGFLRNPEFTTKRSGEKFAITETSTELTRFNVAAMIDIVPRAWSEPTFGGFVQFGISPKNNETAFFVGFGMQLESMLTFGAGAMIQQVRRLDGQSVGDLLDTPDDLKVARPFKSALYIHATVELAKKK